MTVKEIMEKLECTEEEALQMLEDDKAIDRGAKMFELSPEQAKASKDARSVDRKPTEQKAKREKKVDADKHEIFQALDDEMCNVCDNVEVLTQDRELLVWYNDRKFKITLSCPRK